MLVWISNSASFACCVAYCIVSIAFLKLRKSEPDMKRPFSVGNYKVIGVMAVIMSGLLCMMHLISGSGSTLNLQEMVITVGWTVIGLIFAIVCKGKYKDKFGKSNR